MSDGWERNVITIPVSAEMAEDLRAMAPLHRAINEQMLDGLEEMQLRLAGTPRLGPGRSELWLIETPERERRAAARRRRALRRDVLAQMPGRRPGRFQRAHR